MLLLFIDSIVLDSRYIAGANIGYSRQEVGKTARVKFHLVTFGGGPVSKVEQWLSGNQLS